MLARSAARSFAPSSFAGRVSLPAGITLVAPAARFDRMKTGSEMRSTSPGFVCRSFSSSVCCSIRKSADRTMPFGPPRRSGGEGDQRRRIARQMREDFASGIPSASDREAASAAAVPETTAAAAARSRSSRSPSAAPPQPPAAAPSVPPQARETSPRRRAGRPPAASRTARPKRRARSARHRPRRCPRAA